MKSEDKKQQEFDDAFNFSQEQLVAYILDEISDHKKLAVIERMIEDNKFILERLADLKFYLSTNSIKSLKDYRAFIREDCYLIHHNLTLPSITPFQVNQVMSRIDLSTYQFISSPWRHTWDSAADSKSSKISKATIKKRNSKK